MITLNLDKAHEFKVGEVIHLRITDIQTQSPGRWKLSADDITPLPGAEPTGYGCHGCGLIEEAAADGSLPTNWVRKEFPEQTYFLCKECQTDFRYCRVCGCSDEDPCEDGCFWSEEDLCSACVGKVV